VALKKSQLYSSIWSSCDELRGGMDASQYKDYVLTLLFMKYVSDKYGGKTDSLIEVPNGGSFSDMVKLKGDKEIGDKINKIIGRLAEANDLKGVINIADFNDEEKLGKGKEMQDRLSKLVAIFEMLDFSANRAEQDDLLGDAYEYLMRHFATESGKSKGQFYTPAEVSRIMSKVIGIGSTTTRDQTIYDPTCGSGSLLIKAADEAPHGITIFGQENDLATWALARMNMILHGHDTAELWKGNTLSAPYFKDEKGDLKTFDFAVANPPFSAKSWWSGLDRFNDIFKRFEYGVPPTKNGDYAFFLHLIKSLKSNGKGAIILPHGVLFRGNKEADIRKKLVTHGFIKGIMGLPPNLFYGTSIAASIIVVDKENAHSRTGIFMIDASKGFTKDGNKNRLRSQDIHKIVDVFTKQIEIEGYSRMVPVAEVQSPANDFNLNISRYIDPTEPEDLQDLDAHLRGGIPNHDIEALSKFWKVFPSLRNELFKNGSRAGYSMPRFAANQVKQAILEHQEFKTFSEQVMNMLEQWRKTHEPRLREIREGASQKQVIVSLSEDLLLTFSSMSLLDRYDTYQRLMEYWSDVMQDDVDLIAREGWVNAAKPRLSIEDKDKKLKEEPDLRVGGKKYKMNLVPPSLVRAKFFVAELEAIEKLESRREIAERELQEFVEENADEEGLLEEATNGTGKVTSAAVRERLKAIKNEQGDRDELRTLEKCLFLVEAESQVAKRIKDMQVILDSKVLDRYRNLTEPDIKDLVVVDKWFGAIQAAIRGEVLRLTQQLAHRVRELENRYATPLPKVEEDVGTLRAKVEGHLKRMGLVWT